jgi:hypothetical protein
MAPARPQIDPEPALILSQIPSQFPPERLQAAKERLLEAAKPVVGSNGKPHSPASINVLNIPFDEELFVLPGNWDEMMALVSKSDLVKQMTPLMEWLRTEGDKGTEGK